MADLAATDVTVAIQKKAKIERMGRMSRLTLSLGDGALTVPAGGVPLPAKAVFGMARDTIFGMMLDRVTAGGLVVDYDRTNHKLRFWQAAGFTPAGTVAAPVFTGTEANLSGDAQAYTPAGTNSAPAFAGTAVAAAALVEFTGALPAMVLGALVIGD